MTVKKMLRVYQIHIQMMTVREKKEKEKKATKPATHTFPMANNGYITHISYMINVCSLDMTNYLN